MDSTLEELMLVREEFATEMKAIENMKQKLNDPAPVSEDPNAMAEYLQGLQVLYINFDEY